MSPAIKCLLLLAVVALLFVTEMIPLAMTAVLAAVACSALGLVPENQIFLGLADSTVVLFGGMFVVGAAMFYTGLAQRIGVFIKFLVNRNQIIVLVTGIHLNEFILIDDISDDCF